MALSWPVLSNPDFTFFEFLLCENARPKTSHCLLQHIQRGTCNFLERARDHCTCVHYLRLPSLSVNREVACCHVWYSPCRTATSGSQFVLPGRFVVGVYNAASKVQTFIHVPTTVLKEEVSQLTGSECGTDVT